MEGGEKREPIALYEVPLLAELEVKSLIIKALPQAQLSLQNIILRKKEGKYQAFLMVPANKAEEICILKTVTINKESVTIKKPFTEAQVFIGRIPDTLSIDQIKTQIESQFGKITKIHEGQPHEESKSKLKHCYIQFTNSQDAEKCLFAPRKLIINKSQLRPSRAYAMNQSDETDKKLFLKIISQYEDQDDLELVINDEFKKEGKLREKIRVENGKATIVYTSAAVADKILHSFKGGKIGKYEVILRPYANKDSFTAFLGGLKPTVNIPDLQQAFSPYQPVVSCNVMQGPNSRNGTVTFGSKDAYSQLMVDYKEDLGIKGLFIGQPYITQHMSAKDRNEYKSFQKNKHESKKPATGPMIPPPAMNFPMFPPGGMQQQQPPPFMAPINRPPNNFGPPNQFYQHM